MCASLGRSWMRNSLKTYIFRLNVSLSVRVCMWMKSWTRNFGSLICFHISAILRKTKLILINRVFDTFLSLWTWTYGERKKEQKCNWKCIKYICIVLYFSCNQPHVEMYIVSNSNGSCFLEGGILFFMFVASDRMLS